MSTWEDKSFVVNRKDNMRVMMQLKHKHFCIHSPLCTPTMFNIDLPHINTIKMIENVPFKSSNAPVIVKYDKYELLIQFYKVNPQE